LFKAIAFVENLFWLTLHSYNTGDSLQAGKVDQELEQCSTALRIAVPS